MIVAIDGPAGSGKSTTARAIADRLGFRYLDTGAMYRAATLAVGRAAMSIDDASVHAILSQSRIDLEFAGGTMHVMLNGEDVTAAIRHPEVSAAVSEIAALAPVRNHLVAEQRRLASAYREAGEGVVLDGRDIGTHVFPDAEVKVFLVADSTVRAQRRLAELREQGVDTSYEEVRADIERRDRIDSSRELAPLARAKDAIEVDTTRLSVDEQVSLVEKIVRERRSTDSV